MPLDSRKFVQIVKHHASDGVGGETLKSALRTHPLGVDLNRSERIRAFVGGLSESDKQVLSLILQEAAERAVFGTLCVLDGVGGNFDGSFQVYAVDPDDLKSHVNPEKHGDVARHLFRTML